MSCIVSSTPIRTRLLHKGWTIMSDGHRSKQRRQLLMQSWSSEGLASGELTTRKVKESEKQKRYAREQCDILRALEDLAATERTMYELDNRKDHVMTICKLALANVVMWTREHYFPASYAHATWARLAPFFQLPGVVVSTLRTVSVVLRPFNDRQYNRDLVILCQRVNERQTRLPDGRLLLFSVKEPCRPILHGQKRLIA